jgi:biopolymer transport protein ExbD
MDLYRLRSLLAPALASLFLVLSLCAFVVQRPVSVGIHVPVAQLHPEERPILACDALKMVIWLTLDGKMWINDREVSPDTLRAKIAEIIENRYDQKVYIVADSGVSYGMFADFMSRIVGATPNIQVVLLSGQLFREVKQSFTYEGACVIVVSPEARTVWVGNVLHYLN